MCECGTDEPQWFTEVYSANPSSPPISSCCSLCSNLHKRQFGLEIGKRGDDYDDFKEQNEKKYFLKKRSVEMYIQ